MIEDNERKVPEVICRVTSAAVLSPADQSEASIQVT